jgi:hypothetical protein
VGEGGKQGVEHERILVKNKKGLWGYTGLEVFFLRNYLPKRISRVTGTVVVLSS